MGMLGNTKKRAPVEEWKRSMGSGRAFAGIMKVKTP